MNQSNLIPIRKGQVLNPHGRAGASGLTIKRIRELGRERHEMTGESLGSAVGRLLFQAACDGIVHYADGSTERASIKDRIRAAELLASRLDPEPRANVESPRDAAILGLAEAARRAREDRSRPDAVEVLPRAEVYELARNAPADR